MDQYSRGSVVIENLQYDNPIANASFPAYLYVPLHVTHLPERRWLTRRMEEEDKEIRNENSGSNENKRVSNSSEGGAKI